MVDILRWLLVVAAAGLVWEVGLVNLIASAVWLILWILAEWVLPEGPTARLASRLAPWSLALGLLLFHGFGWVFFVFLALQEAADLWVARRKSDTVGRHSRPTAMVFRTALVVLPLLVTLEPLWSKATTYSTEYQILLMVLGFASLVEAFVLVASWAGLVVGLALGALFVYDQFLSPNLTPADGNFAGVEGTPVAKADAAWQDATLDGSLVLGPVLGNPGSDHMAVWALAAADTQGTVVVKGPDGKEAARVPLTMTAAADGTGSTLITGLTPATKYTYDIVDAGGKSLVATALLPWCSFTTFPADGTDTALRFAFASCHKPLSEDPNDYYGGVVLKERFVLWETLARQSQSEHVDFLLLLGDQLYNDKQFFGALPSPEQWVQIKDDPAALKVQEAKARQLYRDNYVRFWNHPSMRKVLASVPSLMMWDDHEIRDGWGSVAEDRTDPPVEWVGKVAESVNREFQAFSAPRVELPAGQGLGWFDFRFGKTAFFVPDLRGQRDVGKAPDQHPILGAAQAKAIDAWYQSLGKAPTAFLGLEVPLGDTAGWVVDWLSYERSGPRSLGLGDDFRDKLKWQGSRPEVANLLDQTAAWEASTGGRMFALGGDVHVGMLNRVTGPNGARIEEFVSSGIGNQDDTAQSSYSIFSLLAGKTNIGNHTAQSLKSVAEMNYGVVEVGLAPAAGPAPVKFWIVSNSPSAPDSAKFVRMYDDAGAGAGIVWRTLKP
ncbi:MAG: alkaline phosphatase D family protein [Spirochaetales bacterium]